MIRLPSREDSGSSPATDAARQQCIRPACGATYELKSVHQRCEKCGALLDVAYDWERLPVPARLALFDERRASSRNPLDYSGVWRFRELIPFAELDKVLTIGEGQTQLRRTDGVAAYVGLDPGRLFLQYEGLNPSGSFKDNGMTGAFTHANMVGAKYAACASTGNTSASLALFAGVSGLLKAVVFVGSGKIAYGKLSQALDYGATTLQIAGDFDDAMRQVQEVCLQTNLYLMNSLNPFRLEGQKAIMYRVLEGLGWEPPDWIVVPGGNLGNSSAFGKAFAELRQLGLIPRIPRVAIINSTGADTLDRLVNRAGLRWNGGNVGDAAIEAFYAQMDAEKRKAHTIASAIEINRPVNLDKALRTLEVTNGVVRAVPDAAILDAKAMVGAHGFGCEPASAASVAGARLLREQGVIARDERVVCILTGHLLKDPHATVGYHSYDAERLREEFGQFGVAQARHANRPIPVPDDIEAILSIIKDL
ncbi:MAG TPA: threonine synthase [Planctomycetota bacterium]|nr:threonine synthase [Planctomycetota bacterium]